MMNIIFLKERYTELAFGNMIGDISEVYDNINKQLHVLVELDI